jgi:hypothetical protein
MKLMLPFEIVPAAFVSLVEAKKTESFMSRRRAFESDRKE